jgi:hypothetical protein
MGRGCRRAASLPSDRSQSGGNYGSALAAHALAKKQGQGYKQVLLLHACGELALVEAMLPPLPLQKCLAR